MNYIEFRDKYNGQYVDVDNYPEWKYQCFDLAQLYNREVLNVPDYVLAECRVVRNLIYDPVERAQMDEYFDEVDTHAMEQGDLCVWGGNNEYGHIAIYDHYDGENCWYFSQNPNPCQVMIINMEDHHAFRRKKETPPLPPITPTVERDKHKDQIELKEGVIELRVRTQPTTTSDILGKAEEKGIYNYYEVVENEGYKWYKIAENQWVAYSDEWFNVYPKENEKTEEQIKKEFADEIIKHMPEWIYSLIDKEN